MKENTVIFSSYKNKISFKNKLFRLIWNLCYFFFYRPFITKLFNFWRVNLLRLFGAKIGKNCSVSAKVKIWAPWNLVMEDCTLLDSYVNCYNPGNILLKSETVISEGVFLCTASHNIYSSQHELIIKDIIIEGQVWIGVDAFIGMGVTINEGAVVGAKAAVFKDVDAWTVVGGNPAKVIKKRVLDNEQ
jgi:putative colanic acid biosynthesis acetyltransferase WcaF